MTGLKMTTMTLDAMRAAREQGKELSDFESIRRDMAAGIEPADDDDSPDASMMMRAAVEKRRAGRPAGSGSKEQVAIRLDRDILEAFRASGAGWQTRMNAVLREWVNTHPTAS